MVFIKSWIIIGFYSFACNGMGKLASWLLSVLFRTTSMTIQNAIVEYAATMIVGLAFFGIIWTFISMLGFFSPEIIVFSLIPFFLNGCWHIFIDRKRLWNEFKRIRREIGQTGWLYKLMGIASVYSIFVIISNQLTVYPNDASAYYLALAKVISSSHTLKLLPGYYFSAFPSEAIMALGFHGELHLAALHSLGTDHYARYIDIPLLLVSIAVLLGFVSIVGVKVRGLFITTMVVLLTSSVINITAIGKVDVFGIAFILGAIYFAGLFFIDGEDKRSLALCGILIGTAITTKFSYLINMLPAIAVLLLWNIIIIPLKDNRNQVFSTLKNHYKEIGGVVLILGGSVVFSMVSYFAKNQVIWGYFLAPFFLPKDVLKAISILFPDKTVIKLVLSYPFSLSFFDIPSNPGHFPPLVLAFMPNLYFARKYLKLNSLSMASFIAALVSILLWVLFFPGVAFVRYLFAALMLLLPLVIYATEHVLDTVEITSLKTAINGCLLVSVVFGLMNPAFINNQFNLIFARLARNIPPFTFPQCEQDLAINGDATRGDRLLNLSDFRYWLRPDLIECSATTQETNQILSEPKVHFWESVYQNGIKYVSLNLSSKCLEDPIYLPAPEWIRVAEIYRNDNLMTYRLDTSSAPYAPSKRCIQVRPPAWDTVDNH